jgi:hypothetical protein
MIRRSRKTKNHTIMGKGQGVQGQSAGHYGRLYNDWDSSFKEGLKTVSRSKADYNLTMEKATLIMSPDFEVVDVNDYDILLTDIKGETIRTLEIDGSTHLSEAQTSVEPVSVSLNGVTYGDYSRVLVRAVLSAKQTSVNAVMLVDTGSPYTFLTDETFKALGINLEEHPSDQAFVLVNGQRTKAHLSKAHFEEVNVLGTNFLDFCELHVNYPKRTARITIVPV